MFNSENIFNVNFVVEKKIAKYNLNALILLPSQDQSVLKYVLEKNTILSSYRLFLRANVRRLRGFTAFLLQFHRRDNIEISLRLLKRGFDRQGYMLSRAT